jgi:hypothetical protein
MNKNNAYSNSPAGAFSAEAKIKCETTKTQHEKDKRRIIPRGDKWWNVNGGTKISHLLTYRTSLATAYVPLSLRYQIPPHYSTRNL